MLSYEVYSYDSIILVILYMTINIYISFTRAIIYDHSTLHYIRSADPAMRSYHLPNYE